MKDADYYMVQVNLGSAQHSIIPLYEDEEDGDHYISDPVFDAYEDARDVHKGYVNHGGRICFYTGDLIEAEAVATGIDMVREMLKGWLD